MAWLSTQYNIDLSAFPHHLQSLYHSSFRPAYAVSECSPLGLQKTYFKNAFVGLVKVFTGLAPTKEHST